jgi:Acetyltransferases, including N-acetylases of ribosomal proteins
MSGAVFLEGETCNLRTLEKEDAEFLRNLNHNPKIRQYLGRTPEPNSVVEEKDRIDSINESDEIIQFIIEGEGEKVGTIAIFDINRTYRSAEVGAFMVEPSSHGKGIGTEAMKLILNYAFNQLNMHKITGGYIENNDASKIVQEKFGFQKEGREREEVYRNGKYKDIIRMSLLENEWRSE